MPIQEDVIVNYIISDIHGAFNEFKQMLEKIEYNPDSDTMIVAGDVIDRGSDSIELLYYIKDFVDSGQMILLAGNHEFFCAEFIEGGLSVEKYAAFGGRATIKDIIGIWSWFYSNPDIYWITSACNYSYNSHGDMICTQNSGHIFMN